MSPLLAAVPEICNEEDAYEKDECWYIGVGYASTHIKPDRNNTSWRVTDDNDSGLSFYIGHAIDEDLFAEFTYEELGTAELRNLNPAITYPLLVDYNVFDISAGYWLFDNEKDDDFNIYASLGLAILDTDEGPEVDQINGVQLSLGLGIEWFVNDNWSARLRIKAYDKDARSLGISVHRYFDAD